jgi:adenylate cyclase
VEPLLKAELIDQVSFTPRADYAFRHPLIRSVAYRSQLAATRAELHRRLGAVLETRDPESADENAALIAEHLEAAADLPEAFSWHMRAGTWLTFRDIHAARLSWQRAGRVADRMAAEVPGRDAMRLGPRALLCATAFRTGSAFDDATFEETCRLADGLGDKVSLAMAMSGQAVALMFGGRYRESSRVASELIALLEAIGDPTWELTLLHGASTIKFLNGEVAAASRLMQRVIDLADGDALKGASVIESPLTLALMYQAIARICLGTEGWKADLAQAVTLVTEFLPIGQADALIWKYHIGVLAGALPADAAAVRETAKILELTQQRADDLSVWSARFLHGLMLAQQSASDRDRGLSVLGSVREAVTERHSIDAFLPFIDIEFAKEDARQGDIDGAVGALEAILLDDDQPSGGMGPQGRATEIMVELLLQRGEPADIAAAREAIERLEALPVEPGVVVHKIALLRLRTLLAQARGDEVEYQQYRDQYRAMANKIGFEGHIAMAEAMA